MNDKEEQMQEEIETQALSELLTGFMQEDGQRILEEWSKSKTKKPPIKKWYLAVAVLAVALCAIQATAIPSMLKNYYITFLKHSVDISESPQPAGSDFRSTEIPLPTYVPEGYRKTGMAINDGVLQQTYRNQKEEIQFFLYENPSTVRLDSEEADHAEKVTVNGQPGIYISKGDNQILFWGKVPAYQLNCTALEKPELFRMAESVDNRLTNR